MHAGLASLCEGLVGPERVTPQTLTPSSRLEHEGPITAHPSEAACGEGGARVLESSRSDCSREPSLRPIIRRMPSRRESCHGAQGYSSPLITSVPSTTEGPSGTGQKRQALFRGNSSSMYCWTSALAAAELSAPGHQQLVDAGAPLSARPHRLGSHDREGALSEPSASAAVTPAENQSAGRALASALWHSLS